MFGLKQSDDVRWFAGAGAAVALQGRRLFWFASGNEASRWREDFDLPRDVKPGDVASLHPSGAGVTLVAKDGSFAVFDLAVHRWCQRANVFPDREGAA